MEFRLNSSPASSTISSRREARSSSSLSFMAWKKGTSIRIPLASIRARTGTRGISSSRKSQSSVCSFSWGSNSSSRRRVKSASSHAYSRARSRPTSAKEIWLFPFPGHLRVGDHPVAQKGHGQGVQAVLPPVRDPGHRRPPWCRRPLPGPSRRPARNDEVVLQILPGLLDLRILQDAPPGASWQGR